ncbi:hypothetical protein BXZ70DRAFT_915472 [Cristinia sonorae]|uniref:Uncharacterized protein n=1 Tax=Cristinia sonorae TaxID=1940300 RepID=A0A8K0UWW3_9AGAR|nr:hypothetical protein BXZ70DRAFT_915472 [Cristinia sonorae]
MVKPATPQVVRFSPLVSVRRSPFKGGGGSAFIPQGATRNATHPSIKNRFDTSREDDYVDMTSMYRELDGIERDDARKTHKREPMDDDDLLDWDEESTLVALLEDRDMDIDEREELAALADQLKGPMSAQAQRMRQDLRGAIVPAIQQIKKVHDKLEDDVDLSFGKGFLAFDDACKRVEAKVTRDEDDIKTAYHEMKQNMEKLMDQLRDAHRRRDELWADFEGKLGQCVEGARTAIEALPVDIEETISGLDRKNKNMEKKGTDAASKQKMLKGLLEKL